MKMLYQLIILVLCLFCNWPC